MADGIMNLRGGQQPSLRRSHMMDYCWTLSWAQGHRKWAFFVFLLVCDLGMIVVLCVFIQFSLRTLPLNLHNQNVNKAMNSFMVAYFNRFKGCKKRSNEKKNSICLNRKHAVYDPKAWNQWYWSWAWLLKVSCCFLNCFLRGQSLGFYHEPRQKMLYTWKQIEVK